MEELAKRKRETPEMKRKRALLAKLMERVQKLSKEVRGGCSHLIENQKYTETGREDTLGSWKSGMDYKIQCNGCGEVLARWED